MEYHKTVRTGFTLAEVLITLLIIGVVAAIVVPSLINDINDKDLQVQSDTVRGILMTAHRKIRAENGNDISGLDYGREMAKQLNILKDCNAHPQADGCWHAPGTDKITESDGSTTPLTTSSSWYGLVLQNGIMLQLPYGAISCDNPTYNNPDTNACYSAVDYYKGFCTVFLADINGKRGPNTYGKDIREINVYSDRVGILGDQLPPRWNAVRNSKYTNADYEQPGGTCYDPNNYNHTQY